MEFHIGKPVKLFDQIQGYGTINNVLGIGDPHVVKIRDQWTMFIGGFQTNFKNNIFTATLPVGETLSSDRWTITTREGHPNKAMPIISNSGKGSWDSFGYHTPCYVAGRDSDGREVERIYYTGRASNEVVDNQAPYSIGVIEKTPKGWRRHPAPILTGTEDSLNVLEPKARYFDGLWRIWYVTTKQETGKTGYPSYRIQYTESEDGIHHWSKPVTLFDENENYYDASVHPANGPGYEMAVCRSTNLYGRKDFPKQGLWLLEGTEPNGLRDNWSPSPLCILDADEGEEWYRNGIGSPCGHYGESVDDEGTLYMYFTGLHQKRNWLSIAVDRVKKRKVPPFPSPFYFTVGKVELRKLK
jgi:hypothetical protein